MRQEPDKAYDSDDAYDENRSERKSKSYVLGDAFLDVLALRGQELLNAFLRDFSVFYIRNLFPGALAKQIEMLKDVGRTGNHDLLQRHLISALGYFVLKGAGKSLKGVDMDDQEAVRAFVEPFELVLII